MSGRIRLAFWFAVRTPLAAAVAAVLVATTLALTDGAPRSAGALGPGSNGASLCFGQLIATQRNANTATIIDQSSNLVTRTIGVGAQPYAVTYSGDGRFAFVGEAAGRAISMISTSSNSVVRTFSLSADVYNVIVANHDGSVVWAQVYNGSSDNLIRVDTNTGVITIQVVTSFIRDMFLSPDEQSLWTLEYAFPNTVVGRYSAATLATVSSTIVPAHADQGAMTPDGTKIYMPNSSANNVYVFNTQTLTTTTIASTGPLNSAALSPSGTTLYTIIFDGSTHRPAILDPATQTWSYGVDLATIAPYTYFLGIAVTADGSKLYISNMNYAAGGLYVVPAAAPASATYIASEIYNQPAVCPLATDPDPDAAPTTTPSEPVAPVFTA